MLEIVLWKGGSDGKNSGEIKEAVSISHTAGGPDPDQREAGSYSAGSSPGEAYVKLLSLRTFSVSAAAASLYRGAKELSAVRAQELIRQKSPLVDNIRGLVVFKIYFSGQGGSRTLMPCGIRS